MFGVSWNSVYFSTAITKGSGMLASNMHTKNKGKRIPRSIPTTSEAYV